MNEAVQILNDGGAYVRVGPVGMDTNALSAYSGKGCPVGDGPKSISNAPTQTVHIGPSGLDRLAGRTDTRTWPTVLLGRAMRQTHGRTAKVKDHKKRKKKNN
jgi:hypothetical protein